MQKLEHYLIFNSRLSTECLISNSEVIVKVPFNVRDSEHI